VLAAITKMLVADPVSRVDSKSRLRASQGTILTDSHAPMVEEHVVVGAQAEYVVRGVRPVVWRSERPDVRSLRVGTGKSLQARAAHLAPVVIEGFDPSCLGRIPYQPQYRRLSAFGGGMCRRGFQGNIESRGDARKFDGACSARP
jgi:hypothetical protein